MKILFVHQNFPGQFPHLAPELAKRGHDCLALTDLGNTRASPIPVLRYKHEPAKVDPATKKLTCFLKLIILSINMEITLKML